MLYPSLSLLLLLQATAAKATSVPVLAFSYPLEFVGLDEGFNHPTPSLVPSTISFLPPLHACGTLLILSAPGLQYDDFERLPRYGGGAGEYYHEGPGRVKESDALEEEVVEWARGWRKSCGPGEEMREVRVAKVVVDLGSVHDAARTTAAAQLDFLVAAHIHSLPKPPHPHVVILTTLSPESLTSLFAILESTPPLPISANPTRAIPLNTRVPGLGHHGVIHYVWKTIKFSFWVGVLGGGGYLGWQYYELNYGRKYGSIALRGSWALDVESS